MEVGIYCLAGGFPPLNDYKSFAYILPKSYLPSINPKEILSRTNPTHPIPVESYIPPNLFSTHLAPKNTIPEKTPVS
jgi:hypothetical protein